MKPTVNMPIGEYLEILLNAVVANRRIVFEAEQLSRRADDTTTDIDVDVAVTRAMITTASAFLDEAAMVELVKNFETRVALEYEGRLEEVYPQPSKAWPYND